MRYTGAPDRLITISSPASRTSHFTDSKASSEPGFTQPKVFLPNVSEIFQFDSVRFTVKPRDFRASSCTRWMWVQSLSETCVRVRSSSRCLGIHCFTNVFQEIFL